MRAPVSLSAYWNRRLDPLDWKRVRERHDPVRWRQAHSTFLDPATADGIARLGDPRGRRLLEIGCGQGHGTAHLVRSGAVVTGIDVAERRCGVARREVRARSAAGNARFCAANAERLPFAPDSFDLVFCRDVLMYTDPQVVLSECHRVLKPGGRAVFVESLEGIAPLRWFRRLSSSGEYRRFTRHLRWKEIRAIGPPLRRLDASPYYLLSLAAFVCLFTLRSPVLYGHTLRLLQPIDRWLFKRLPFLAHGAWRASVSFERTPR